MNLCPINPQNPESRKHMSTDTPRTDAAFHQYNEDAKYSTFRDAIRNIERELNEAKEWEKKFKDLDRSLMCELRDPNGTIWECAKTLQDERDALHSEATTLRAECERLRAEGDKDWRDARAQAVENDALRARVAELEAQLTSLEQDKARLLAIVHDATEVGMGDDAHDLKVRRASRQAIDAARTP